MKASRRIARSVLALAVTGALAGTASWSSFSSTVGNFGNAFAAGTVAIGDNDAGQALLSMTGARPGDSVSGCVKVTYTGSLGATVRLYAAVSGALAPYLDVVVTRGTDPAPSFPSCAGFTPDAVDYIGQGPGVVYSGTLAAFPSSWAAASDDPGAWTQGDSHSYRVKVALRNDAAAQGLSGSASFTWEARNS